MKKILICIVAAVTIFSIGIVPQQILSGVTHYNAVMPQEYEYQPEFSCSGVVIADEGIKLLVNANVIVKKLMVDNGSWVEAGQIIAVTEPPAIDETFLSQSIDIIGGTSGFSESELSSFAAQYGLDMAAVGTASAAKEESQLATVTTAREAVAPISGIITWNSVSVGRFIPAGSQLCTILAMDNYKAIVQVPADDARLIALGANAYITGSEIDYQKYEGTVTSVGNTVSKGVTAGGCTSTIEVEIAVDAPADSIRHGASISCTILTGEQKRLLTLPYEAIHQDDHNLEYVYCLDGSKLKKQYVKTGLELDDCIEITSGIGVKTAIATGCNEKAVDKFVLNGSVIRDKSVK